MQRILFPLLAILFSYGCKNSGKEIMPVLKNITQAVYASGKVYPKNDYKVFSKLPGYIEKIHVRVGDSVKVGEPLLTIKSEVSELNVSSSKNLLELAQKNANENSAYITALKQDVASARSKYEIDSINFKRFSALVKENATSAAQYDQAKTQFDISRQSYLKAVSTLATARDRLRVELENARIQYEAQVSNKNDYTITSAVNGKVYDIIPNEGELVNTQTPLMEIGDGGHFEVELSVDETDISLVKEKQEIVYSIDAYKGKVFKGHVLELYPRINQANKTSKVIAAIDLDPQTIIYSGMSVEANIIVAEKENALVIPREYLIEGNKVRTKDQDEPVMVTKGAEDLEFVEIVNGIDESTVIVKP